MFLKVSKNTEKPANSNISFWKSLKEVINEMATMNRYKTCDKEEDSNLQKKPAIFQPWFVHWSIMWGFIGLLIATVLDFMFKDPVTDIWWPSRILGTIGGLLLVYGTSIAINYRLNKVTKAYSETRLADWTFLIFLWIAGITGFWLEVSVTLSANYLLTKIVLLVHTVISMELLFLFAFSKFAHAVYRPLALFFHFKNGSIK